MEQLRDYRGSFTPPQVADYLVELAELQSGMHILDPCAGEGAIEQAVSRYLAFQHTVSIDTYEINPEYLDELCKPMLPGRRTNYFGGDFLDPYTYTGGIPVYDRVIMNPPFDGDMWCRFVIKSFDLLKSGGILVSIVPTQFEGESVGGHYRVQYMKFMEGIGSIAMNEYPLKNWVSKNDGTPSKWGIKIIKLRKK